MGSSPAVLVDDDEKHAAGAAPTTTTTLPAAYDDEASSSAEMTWTDEEEAAVRRKLDWQIVPMVTFLYLLCFLDRANIGNARIQGMEEDLNLYGYRFNIAVSVFYIVYMTVEVPSNVILKRVGPRFYLPFLVFGFGLVSLCTAFVSTYQQLCGLRALLGVFEGGAMPGISFFLSCFYRRRELYFRVGVFVSAASMAGAFGGLLAAGLSQIPPWGAASMRIDTWRNIFFFEGLLTMLAALAAPLVLPQSPGTSRVLTPRQRVIAAERLRREFKSGSDPDEHVQPRHVSRALRNVNNYVCAAGFFMINVTVQGLSVFMPTLLKEMGRTSLTAQYYTVPVYVVASAVSIAVGLLSDKSRRRGIWLAGFTFLGITGFSLLRWTPSSGGDNADSVRYAAVYLCAVAAFPGGPGFLSWGLNNSSGPAIRAVSGAWIVTLGTAGGILAVWAYLPSDGPYYPIGHSINLAAQITVLALSVGGILYCKWENRVRERGGRDDRLLGLDEKERAELGYRDPEFRYIA